MRFTHVQKQYANHNVPCSRLNLNSAFVGLTVQPRYSICPSWAMESKLQTASCCDFGARKERTDFRVGIAELDIIRRLRNPVRGGPLHATTALSCSTHSYVSCFSWFSPAACASRFTRATRLTAETSVCKACCRHRCFTAILSRANAKCLCLGSV